MQDSHDLVKSVVLQSTKCTSEGQKLVMWALSTIRFFAFNLAPFNLEKRDLHNIYFNIRQIIKEILDIITFKSC